MKSLLLDKAQTEDKSSVWAILSLDPDGLCFSGAANLLIFQLFLYIFTADYLDCVFSVNKKLKYTFHFGLPYFSLI